MGRPTLTTLLLFVVVFISQGAGQLVGITPAFFILAVPLDHQPWTIILSIYAHADVTHLAANSLALIIVGPLVGYITTSVRYHLFFIFSGAIAGVTQVIATVPTGSTPVVGASGAIFAFLGYLLIGNRASEWALSWLPLGSTGRIILFIIIAGAVTITTAAPGVALVSHFTGFFIGALAGQFRLLHIPRETPQPQ